MKFINNLNFGRLKDGLSKTRKKLVQSINETFSGKAVIDDNTFDDLEEVLITSDIGYELVDNIIEKVRIKLKDEKDRSSNNILKILKDELSSVLLLKNNQSESVENYKKNIKPYVILVVGVNGVGKTTTIGKLAYNYKQGGAQVIVGAADTFRAAASEQLDIWADRAGVRIIQKEHGSDPSAVAFDAVKAAVNDNYDVVLIDTAGRLHSKANLMNELAKIKRAIEKVLPDAPNEILLILDGTVGQNAIIQAQEFSKITNVTGLVITKLDGTAKGGAVFQICSKLSIPVKYIGVGEKIDDLQVFNAELFISALFGNEQENE